MSASSRRAFALFPVLVAASASLLTSLSLQAQALVPVPTPSASGSPHLTATTPANAEATAPAQALETVIVKSPKNAAVMPYDVVYERLKRLQDSKLDRVRLQIKLSPNIEGLRMQDVRVAIVNDSVSVNLPIAADGTIELPVRADLHKTDAEIRSNQPKDALKAAITLGIGWPGGNEIAYADVEETIRQLQHAGKDVMGWFAYMLFFPSLTNFEVPVQFPEPHGQTLKVMKDGRAVETYTADAKGLLKFKLKPAWSQLQPTLVFSEALPASRP
jgi:hypothetical protein